MNNVLAPEFDIIRWIGSITVIIEYLSDEPLFCIGSGAVLVMAAMLLFYRLTKYDRY